MAPRIRTMVMTTVAAAAAVAASTSAMAATRQLPRSFSTSSFVYRLGSSLYVPLTARCNGRTLPQLRGDGFVLPRPVVEALCRVREAEQTSFRGIHRDPLPTVDSREPAGGSSSRIKLPPPPWEAVSSLPPLPEGHERYPRLDDLVREVEDELRRAISTNPEPEEGRTKTNTIESIVLAGEGEPTLRWEDTIELVGRLRGLTQGLLPATAPPLPIRLTTNGLVTARDNSSASPAQVLWDAGVSRVSVNLVTGDPEQYHDLVRPVLPEDSSSGWDTVCAFVREAVNVAGDLEVEVTAIDRPDVDKSQTQALADSLGVRVPVRWRPYVP